jgi:hypothetical protein
LTVLEVAAREQRGARDDGLGRAYHGRVPKRSNLFQEVVEILHRHMAGNATVEASAMLPSQSTGALREVDVVIRAKQAGHDVIVSVEAMARSRKA